jgi:DNA polymerase-2
VKHFNGFLISRQWRESHNGLLLRYWLNTDEGALLVEQTSQEGIFFVEQPHLEKALSLVKNLYHRTRPLALKSFSQHPVFGFYFTSQKNLRTAAQRLKDHHIPPLESDIRTVDRYLMERFVTSTMQVSGDFISNQHETTRPTFKHVYNAKLEPIKFTPKLRIVSFDIETNYLENTLLSIAVYSESDTGDNVNIVFIVGLSSELNCLNFKDEKTLLVAFIKWIQDYDPDILIGWNCINFDLRFLHNACIRLGLKLNIGRNNEAIEWRSSSNINASSNTFQHYFVLVPGRAVLDGIDTLKSATFNFESYALDFVAFSLLGRGKLINKVSNKADEILRLYNEDRPAFIKYNIEDCVLVWEIFKKAKLIEFAIERARLTGLPLDKIGGSVAAFENQYLPRLHRQGYVAPNLPINPQGVGSPGGYVMSSKPGFYNNVLVLDFKSLYPSIIRSFMVDPYGLAEGDRLFNSSIKINNVGEDKNNNYDKLNFSKGFNGAYFKKQDSILPTLIENLWRARDEAKKESNQALSQAIKIIMNSFYGVMGTPGCRFFDARLPSSITLRGHQIMLRTQELIETKGYEVIYGDTDSIFVWLDQKVSADEANTIGKELARDITLWWNNHLAQEYQLQSALELEYETHFTRFLMPTIRGSEQGSKKRYAGLVCQKDFTFEHPTPSSYKLVFKGLEAVRTDWTPLAREFQTHLYQKVFLNQEFESYILEVITQLQSGILDDKLVYRKRLRRTLSDYKRNVPPHVQAARKADLEAVKAGLKPHYSNGGWIEYFYTLHGPEPKDYLKSPLDYERYIHGQIEPIVDGIVTFLGTSFSKITSRQINLI